MRTRSTTTTYFSRLLVALALLLCGAGAEAAGGIKDIFKGSKADRQEQQEQEVDIFYLTLEDNIYEPAVTRNAEWVAATQLSEARNLKKKGYMVELMRSGEVIVITIPAGQLFAPNDTVLTDLGLRALKPLSRYLETPEMWKMLLVMHTDNTGSDAYLRTLSRARVDAVYGWFDATGKADFVVPYALGPDEPLKPNNSIDNRRLNRRLEIYLVPGRTMLRRAAEKK